jgi:hypothetical protein
VWSLLSAHWEAIEEILTKYLNIISEEYVPSMELAFWRIVLVTIFICNAAVKEGQAHPDDANDDGTGKKRDIIYGRMNLPSSAQEVVKSQLLVPHIVKFFFTSNIILTKHRST